MSTQDTERAASIVSGWASASIETARLSCHARGDLADRIAALLATVRAETLEEAAGVVDRASDEERAMAERLDNAGHGKLAGSQLGEARRLTELAAAIRALSAGEQE